MHERFDNISLRSMEQESLINSLHDKFEKQKEHYQPKPESFIGDPRFNDEEIQKEIEQAKKLKDRWQGERSENDSENKKLSDVFEGIIVDQFCGSWMANQAEAFFTAEPDDYLRKVDCVVEFHPTEENEQREYLGIGIDVTFSSDYSTVTNKLDSVWADVLHSKKVKVKYVDTEHFKGSLDVCRVVVVANKETVIELAKLYKQKDKSEIDEHPYLANILFQIKRQLEAYYTYAKDKGAKSDYLSHVTKTLSTFYKVYGSKEDFVTQHAQGVEDSDLYKTVDDYCAEKLKTK